MIISQLLFFTNWSRRGNKSLGFGGLKTRQGRSGGICNNLLNIDTLVEGFFNGRQFAIQQDDNAMIDPIFCVNPSLSMSYYIALYSIIK